MKTTADFLAAITPEAKAQILGSIAKDYGVTVAEIEAEVTDADAEHLLDYMRGAARTAASVLMQNTEPANMAQSIEQFLDARAARRNAAEDRFLAREEKRNQRAEKMIGELCRNGATVLYIYPAGGTYREGKRHELIAFLKRNKYV